MGLPMLREQARGLTRDQRNAFVAAWLGWAMDAFDYFLLVFVISDVAKDFDTSKTKVAVATTLTLAARPVGVEYTQPLLHVFERTLVEREAGLQCLVLPSEVSQFIRAPRHAAPLSSYRCGVPLCD